MQSYGKSEKAEVSEVASEECMRAVPTLGEAQRYTLRRRVRRASSTDAACLIGGCGVPRQRVRRASSKGEVLEVSSDAKDVEREDLRIRHTVCSPSAPEKWAEEESQRNLVLAHNSLMVRFGLNYARRWSRVRRDEEPTAEGDGAGSERKKPRGGRLDGPGRLFGRPEASNRTARAV